jgi:hypothetical protein
VRYSEANSPRTRNCCPNPNSGSFCTVRECEIFGSELPKNPQLLHQPKQRFVLHRFGNVRYATKALVNATSVQHKRKPVWSSGQDANTNNGVGSLGSIPSTGKFFLGFGTEPPQLVASARTARFAQQKQLQFIVRTMKTKSQLKSLLLHGRKHAPGILYFDPFIVLLSLWFRSSAGDHCDIRGGYFAFSFLRR